MKTIAKAQIAAGFFAACFNLSGGAVMAAPSLSQPGQDIQKELPKPEAEVVDNAPDKPRQAPQVEFTITADELSYYDHDLRWVCEPGDFDIFIGPDCQRGEPARLTVTE